MFAKKFLSIVALVFTGSQISSVSAALTPCTQEVKDFVPTTNGSCTPINSYCVDDDNLIYAIDETPTCKVALNGVYAFNENTGAIITVGSFNIGTEAIGDNFFLYNCDGTTCAKTSGIVKDSTNTNYVVAAAGGTSSALGHEVTECAVGKIDTDSGNVLCITTALTASKPDTRYIMENVAANAFGTGSSNTDKSIIIKTATNIFAFDNLLTGTDYCVDKNGEVFDRKTGLCKATVTSGEDCDAYYNCNEGVCTSSDANVNPRQDCIPDAGTKCEEGFYLVKNSGLITDTTTTDAVIWECFGTGNGNCEDKTGILGYFKNAATINQYIECTVTRCQGMAAITATECGAAAGGNTVATGSLFNSADPKFCIYNQSNVSKTLSTDDGYYFVSTATSLFGLKTAANHFIAIKIASGNLTVLKETVRYRYTLSGENEIHLRADAKEETSGGQICNPSVTPDEYILDQWTSASTIDSAKADYYVKEN